ncbi:MAG: enoyl-CoA hydratase/isomerase family protein [Desulforhopalus sp.]
MNNTTILVDLDSRGVATITLNNPDKHNAFDDTIIQELSSALAELAANPDLRVLILAAAGKTFCAGGDLEWMKRMARYSYDENLGDAEKLAAMLKALNFFPRPTIARVQGAAFGGAVGLISCCDMAVATPQAIFALSEVKIGLIPAVISPYVIDAIGQRAARRYFTTGERFSAETATSLGLISELVQEQLLDEKIDELVEIYSDNGPAAVAAAKQLVFRVAPRMISEDLVRYTSEEISRIRVSEEGQEGITAFLEKRKPAWSQ